MTPKQFQSARKRSIARRERLENSKDVVKLTTEYTDLQRTVLLKYVLNSGSTLEQCLVDNCNPIDAPEVAGILGCSKAVANGVLVSLHNKGIIYPYEVNFEPLYMFSDHGIRELFRLREEQKNKA